MPYDYLRQREIEQQRVEKERASGLFTAFAGGIGAIALGSTIYSKFAGRSVGNVVATFINYLGHPNSAGLSESIDKLANINKSAPRSGSGLRNFLQGTVRSDGRLQLGPIDLIEDLKHSLWMLGSVKNNTARAQLRTRAIEYINREGTKQLYSSFYGAEFQRVTLGEVLKNQKTWSKILNPDQFNTLFKAKREGLIADTHVIDKNLFLNKKRQLFDTRVGSIFGGESLFNRITGGIDLFGQAGVIKSLVGSKAGVAILNPNQQTISKVAAGKTFNTHKGPRFFIGGNVYAYDKAGKEHILASNQVLRYADDPLSAVTLAKQGEIQPSYRRMSRYYKDLPYNIPFKLRRKLVQAELKTGVGFSFATRHPIIAKLVHPFLRAKALYKGEAVVYKKAFRKEHETSSLTDAFIGPDIPEIVRRQGRSIPIPGGGVTEDFRNLSFGNKLGVLTGLSDDYVLLHRQRFEEAVRGKRLLSNNELYIPKPETGMSKAPGLPHGFIGYPGYSHDIVTEAGDRLTIAKSPYYNVDASRIFPKVTSLSTFSNYLFARVNSLASDSLLGLGFAPAKTTLGTATRLAAIPLIYQAGAQYLKYADYALEDATGFSPIKAAADAFAFSKTTLQDVRQALGVQPLAAELEKNFPGSFSSEGSTIIRTAAPLVGGLLSLASGNKAGFIAGSLGSLLLGPGVEQSPEDVRRELSGDKKVAVRKGAWWSLGYDPLFGGKVKHYEHHWYHKLKTDASKTGLYGSKDEYYRSNFSAFGVPLPTFHNLLGFENLLDPYSWENKNYYTRPYLQTGNDLENFPIFGPVLGATVGRLLKPTQFRTIDDLPLLKAGLVDRGLDPATAQMLGIPSIAASEIPLQDTQQPIHVLRKLGDVALEPAGVYKFALEYFGVNLGPTYLPRVATSDVATSPGRALYGLNIGGALGNTEFIRRFMLSEYSSTYRLNQLYNPIPNAMPDWLPGSGARNELDQSYFIDFHRGDPYLKIDKGELRLPGQGYEAANLLHSSTPGVYDDVDKFMILADVAPYSQQYKALKSRVSRMNLGEDWNLRVQEAIDQVETVTGIDNRYPRYMETLENINLNIHESAAYKDLRRTYDTLTHDVLAEIPWIGSKLFPFRSPYEEYRKRRVIGAEYADWNAPYETILRPMYHEAASEDPFTAGMQGFVLGNLVGGKYAPFKMFMPFQSMTRASVPYYAAGAFAAAPIFEQGLLGKNQDMVPDHIVEESNALTYLDNLSYAKYRSLELNAHVMGNTELAQAYGKQTRRTMVGASHPLTLSSTLPTSFDRRYFRYFAKEGIGVGNAEGLQPYMRRALERVWSKEYNSTQSADEEVAAYFASNPLPSSDYLGYQAGVPSQAMKLHAVQHGLQGISDNIHRYGFFENHENELRLRFPDLQAQEVHFQPTPTFRNPVEFFQTFSERAGYTYRANTVVSPYYNNMQGVLEVDKKDQTKSLMRSYSRTI